MRALRWVAHLATERGGASVQTRDRQRRASITEIALEHVLEEGILVKKAVSARFRRSWQRRFFKLHADSMELEYFDAILHESIPLRSAASEARPTNMSVHREAVEDGINPIWFQKQCRYTFSLAFVVGEKSGRESQVDFGTNSDSHRSAWLGALNDHIRLGGKGSEKESGTNFAGQLRRDVVVEFDPEETTLRGTNFRGETRGLDGAAAPRPRRASNTVAPSPAHRRIGAVPTARA